MRAPRPVISLIAPREPERFLQLAAAVRRWCDVVALGQEEGRRMQAVVATSPLVEVPEGPPAAVWVQHEDELSERIVTERAVAVLATRAELLAGVGRRGLLVPTGDPVPEAAYLSPFVRQRLQQARGLPPMPVIEERDGTWGWPGHRGPLPESLVPTALACAAAASVESEPALQAALAFGTPTVSDVVSASTVGAVTGQQVLTADTARDRRRLAEDLARDATTASRLSWAGRCHYERRHDMKRTAIILVSRLLASSKTSAGPLADLELRLGELNTPMTATIRSRLMSATAGLPGLA